MRGDSSGAGGGWCRVGVAWVRVTRVGEVEEGLPMPASAGAAKGPAGGLESNGVSRRTEVVCGGVTCHFQKVPQPRPRPAAAGDADAEAEADEYLGTGLGLARKCRRHIHSSKHDMTRIWDFVQSIWNINEYPIS